MPREPRLATRVSSTPSSSQATLSRLASSARLLLASTVRLVLAPMWPGEDCWPLPLHGIHIQSAGAGVWSLS